MSNEPTNKPSEEESKPPTIDIEEGKKRFGHLSTMNYHGATKEIERSTGGGRPRCPRCGEPMFPIDDHGRYSCTCSLGSFVDLAADDDL